MADKLVQYVRDHGYSAWFADDSIIIEIPYFSDAGWDVERVLVEPNFRAVREMIGY